MVSYLRDFTDLPLGAYPNLGYLTNEGWRQDPGVSGAEYAELALRWRAEGAQIVGGCCGVGPEHIAAARERLAGTSPGRRRAEPAEPAASGGRGGARQRRAAWTDNRGRELYPLDVPRPRLRSRRLRARRRQLPRLALPRARGHRRAPALPRRRLRHRRPDACSSRSTGRRTCTRSTSTRRAVANTLANAFRNGVADQVSAAAADLLPWTPEERYEVIVASLQQQPADPFQQTSTHRPVDYWGRILLDQLLAKLAPGAGARGRRLRRPPLRPLARGNRPAARGRRPGAAVVDVGLFPFPPELEAARTQIRRVEELSDAYHVQLGGHDVMAAYLLEIRHAGGRRPGVAAGGMSDAISRSTRRDTDGPARGPSGDPSRRLEEARALVAAVLDDPAASAALAPLERIADAHRALCALLTGAAAAEADELLVLAGRLVREGYEARLEAHERVAAALARLAELGPVTEIVDRGALEACAAVDLDRVVLSRVDDGALLAEAVHWRDDPGMAATTLALLREGPVRLDYPLIESEMVRRRRPLLVAHPDADPRGRPANAAIIGWRDFVASPILLEGRVTGFLHGDRLPTGRSVTALERETLWSFAQGFARVFERAVLRRRLRTQREEMRQVASWADARTGELSTARSTSRRPRAPSRPPGPRSARKPSCATCSRGASSTCCGCWSRATPTRLSRARS